MPFKSKAQQRWMFANHPEMAHRWAHETPDIKKLPKKLKRKKMDKKAEEIGRLVDLIMEPLRRAVKKG